MVELVPKSQWRVYSKDELGVLTWKAGNGFRSSFRYKNGEVKVVTCSPYVIEAIPLFEAEPGSGKRNTKYADDKGQGFYRLLVNGRYYFLKVIESGMFPDALPKNVITCWSTTDSDKSKKVEPILKDFIYKVDDSSKLRTVSNYDSIDEFFDVEIVGSPIYVSIVSVDTKETIAKIERSKAGCKFIVELTNSNGEEFIIRSIIKDKESLNKLIEQTVEALNAYPQFAKYADDLEDALD